MRHVSEVVCKSCKHPMTLMFKHFDSMDKLVAEDYRCMVCGICDIKKYGKNSSPS